MAKVIVSKQSQVIGEFELDESKTTFTVGASAENDIVVAESKIAAKQLKIERRNSSFYIEPIAEQPVVQINGRPFRYRLQFSHSDTLTLGGHVLTFEKETPQPIQQPEEKENLDVISEESPNAVYDYPRPDVSQPAKPNNPISVDEEKKETHTRTNEFYEIDDLSDEFKLEPESDENDERLEAEILQEPEAEVRLEQEDLEQEDKESVEVEMPEETATEIEGWQPENGKESAYCLIAIYGPYVGRKFPLRLGDTRIGRDNSLNDIVIRNNEGGALDPSISRRHATISYRKGMFYVTDKRSKTRTYVNQSKLAPEDEFPVYEGDEIEIVSDQKSTIFRLASRANPDLKPPKRAGTWWSRNNVRIGLIASLVLAFTALTTFGLSCKNQLAAKSKPDGLKFFEETWFQVSNQIANEIIFRGDLRANLAVDDLTGNSVVNVVFVDGAGAIRVLDSQTKEVVWLNNRLNLLPNIPPVLADLNGNGLPDVVAVGSGGRLYALDGVSGAEIWNSPLLGEILSSPPVINDFNSDGLQDVAIFTMDGDLHLGYGGLAEMTWKTMPTAQTVESVPVSADWDGDGRAEIFAGTDEGKVLVVDAAAGALKHIFDFSTAVAKATGDETEEQPIRFPVALADINGNYLLDLIIVSARGNSLAIESNTLSTIWHQKLHADFTGLFEPLAPVCGRIDGDNLEDAVLATNRSLKVIASVTDLPGKQKHLWEYYANGNDYLVTPPALADLDKDGSNEVIIGSQSGTISVFSGVSGKIIAEVRNSGNPVISPVLVADIGANGTLDIIYRRQDGHVYIAQSNSPVNENAVVWGQAFGDPQHTGRAHYAPPGSGVYNLSAASLSVLFIFIGFFTIRTKSRRIKRIAANQNGVAAN